MTESQPKPLLTFLDIVNTCDNVRVHQSCPIPSPFESENLVPLYLSESPDSPAIGLLRPVIVEQLELENQRSRDLGGQEMWAIRVIDSTQIARRGRKIGPSVSLHNWLDTPSKRTAAIKEVSERWRDTRLFDDVCGPNKWRDELYPVYADPFGPHDNPNDVAAGEKLNFVFEMERSACALFGVVSYGVHMNIYKEVEVDGKKNLQVWIPTRSRTKQTYVCPSFRIGVGNFPVCECRYPGLLDNSVAGGVPSGMSMFESMVKECMEEASIADHVVRKYARATGAISYFIRFWLYDILYCRNANSCWAGPPWAGFSLRLSKYQ